MKFIDAVNEVLRSGNKAAVNDLDDQSQDLQLAKRVVQSTRTEVLSNGYRFSRRKTTITPDQNSKVPIPATYLDVVLGKDELSMQVDVSDGKRYVWNHKENAWEDEAVEDLEFQFDLDTDNHFALMPYKLAWYITRKAASAFFFEVNKQESPDLIRREVRSQSLWVNSEEFSKIHEVTGFYGLSARGHGPVSGSFDPRTQSQV